MKSVDFITFEHNTYNCKTAISLKDDEMNTRSPPGQICHLPARLPPTQPVPFEFLIMASTTAAAAAASSAEEIAPAVKESMEKMQLWIKKWFNDVKGYKSTESTQCILRFGVCTDSQYADIDDGKSFMGVKRYYRNALVLLQRAFDCWYRLLSCVQMSLCEHTTTCANNISFAYARRQLTWCILFVACLDDECAIRNECPGYVP